MITKTPRNWSLYQCSTFAGSRMMAESVTVFALSRGLLMAQNQQKVSGALKRNLQGFPRNKSTIVAHDMSDLTGGRDAVQK